MVQCTRMSDILRTLFPCIHASDFAPNDMDSFVAGFAYGATTVIVGQPLDTVKTRMQAMETSRGPLEVGLSLYRKEGLRGLYRGGVPLLIGGGLMRSAQFGVYENTLKAIRAAQGRATEQQDKLFGFIDPQVLLAGFAGGIGRGIVEGPFENIKVRRQVESGWVLRELYIGSGTTIFRNSLLFSLFVLYMDISKQVFEGGMSPFMTGSVCATAAWLSIWPLDVVKSQIQSGRVSAAPHGAIGLLKSAYRSGAMYRGLVPGLTRSAIANGLSMMVYKEVEKALRAAMAQSE